MKVSARQLDATGKKSMRQARRENICMTNDAPDTPSTRYNKPHCKHCTEDVFGEYKNNIFYYCLLKMTSQQTINTSDRT